MKYLLDNDYTKEEFFNVDVYRRSYKGFTLIIDVYRDNKVEFYVKGSMFAKEQDIIDLTSAFNLVKHDAHIVEEELTNE